jgi:hypothetical protein
VLADGEVTTLATGVLHKGTGSGSPPTRCSRLHLEDGCATDGTRVLTAASMAEMQRPQVAVPNPHAMADHWGLGWALSD